MHGRRHLLGHATVACWRGRCHDGRTRRARATAAVEEEQMQSQPPSPTPHQWLLADVAEERAGRCRRASRRHTMRCASRGRLARRLPSLSPQPPQPPLPRQVSLHRSYQRRAARAKSDVACTLYHFRTVTLHASAIHLPNGGAHSSSAVQSFCTRSSTGTGTLSMFNLLRSPLLSAYRAGCVPCNGRGTAGAQPDRGPATASLCAQSVCSFCRKCKRFTAAFLSGLPASRLHTA